MLHTSILWFGLVHIPTCAGVTFASTLASVTIILEATSSVDLPGLTLRDGEGWSVQNVPYPELSNIHFAHLPLSLLKYSSPAPGALISSDPSVAVEDDPQSHFMPGLMPRTRELKGCGVTDICPEDLQREAIKVVNWVDERDVLVDHEYIYFTRHSDSVDLEDHCIVVAVFSIKRLDASWSRASKPFSQNYQTALQASASLAPHCSLHREYQRAAPTYGPVVAEQVRQRFFAPLKRVGLLDVSKTHASLSFGADVEWFIETFHAMDLEIQRTALAEWER